VTCACGCGVLVTPDDRARPRRFVHGHNRRGLENPWKANPTSTLASTGYIRARKIAGRGPCRLRRIGGCKGKVHVHHRDENPLNNDPSNHVHLCSAHHRLVHNGRIDLDRPVMPPYYVDGSGKRRYARAA
jgi:hypothetical protein